MYYIEDNNYLALLASTYAVVVNDRKKVKELFETYVVDVPMEKMSELFAAHYFSTSLTVEQYMSYQYFYGINLIYKTINDNDLGIQIEKLFRECFRDIYKMVRTHKEFNIMDYYFLYIEGENLTLMDKLSFSNRAVALVFFILNKWGKNNCEAVKFCQMLYDIVVQDKKNICGKNSYEANADEIESARKRIYNLYKNEMSEIAFDKIYEMYNINFDMLYLDCGDKRTTYEKIVCIEKIVWGQIQNADSIIDFLVYNVAILLATIESNMKYMNDSELYMNRYINEKLKEEIRRLKDIVAKLQIKNDGLIEEKNEVITNLNRQNNVQKEKISRIEDEILDYRRLLKETNSLRNYVYQIVNYKTDEYENTNNLDWNKLNNVSGLIIGGNEGWQSRMKKRLPKWKFVHSSINSLDKKIFSNVGYVFVNTSFIGHSLYYGVVSIVQNLDVKIGFINSLNERRVYEELVNQLD